MFVQTDGVNENRSTDCVKNITNPFLRRIQTSNRCKNQSSAVEKFLCEFLSYSGSSNSSGFIARPYSRRGFFSRSGFRYTCQNGYSLDITSGKCEETFEPTRSTNETSIGKHKNILAFLRWRNKNIN